MLVPQKLQPDRLLRLGGALCVFGMIATAVAFTPLFSGVALTPIWWAMSMVTGLGLVIVVLGLRAQATLRSRQMAAVKGEL